MLPCCLINPLESLLNLSEPAGWEIALELIATEKVKMTGNLNLGSLGLTDLPEELFELEHLTHLNLGSAVLDGQIWRNSKIMIILMT